MASIREKKKSLKILIIDPYLTPYEADLRLRMDKYKETREQLVGDCDICDFAQGYRYFGIHFEDGCGVYREWAPGAVRMYFTGDFADWELFRYEMQNIGDGVFEIKLPRGLLCEGQKVQAIVIGESGEVLRRVPSYATRVVQDPVTYLWCCEVCDVVDDGFSWSDAGFAPPKTPYIYECHIGMATEEYKVGSYAEFERDVLPRVKALGYNTIQIMAVMEHPYYGSFGYQVSSFFAASSRQGTPTELKHLIDTAHRMKIAVLLDVVHSHAVKNTGDGLNLFDGTEPLLLSSNRQQR